MKRTRKSISTTADIALYITLELLNLDHIRAKVCQHRTGEGPRDNR
jgi:hypothetical protein